MQFWLKLATFMHAGCRLIKVTFYYNMSFSKFSDYLLSLEKVLDDENVTPRLYRRYCRYVVLDAEVNASGYREYN